MVKVDQVVIMPMKLLVDLEDVAAILKKVLKMGMGAVPVTVAISVQQVEMVLLFVGLTVISWSILQMQGISQEIRVPQV
jgi:hypothetical protein